MDWEAIAAIGEIVGALAVVVTLAFLVYQLRQTTMALKQQSERASADALHAWSLTMMDPNVAEAVNRGYRETTDAFTPEQLISLEHFAMAFLVALQQDYFDWKRGFQSHDLWASRAGLIEGVFVSVQVRKWWDVIGKAYVVPEFKDLIDEVISNPTVRTGDYWKDYRNE